MEKRSDLHLLNKALGETPNECILRFKNDNPEYKDVTMSYAGRLDPMAEGLLVVLFGENLKIKEKFLHLPKTYEFEILWGFETDTLDLLGKVLKTDENNVSEKDLKEVLNSKGKFTQSYPAYSSKPVSGKALFKWAREGRLTQIEIPTHEVEIFNTEFISRRQIEKEELLENILERIGKVSGDFRQTEIINDWKNIFSKTKQTNFIIDKIIISVSSGFYVRQFVSDLAKKLNTSGVTFSIKRTIVGDYELRD
jgi:tRNA pseudouridine(55) synthase